MGIELVNSSHAVGESNYHIQLTPAYRQDIFIEPMVRELTLAYIVEKLRKHKVILSAYDYGPDHLHLFVSNVRFIGEVELVRQIKGFSSYMMRKGHWYMFKDKLWGKKFWSVKDIFTEVLVLLPKKAYIGMLKRVRRSIGKGIPMKSIKL